MKPVIKLTIGRRFDNRNQGLSDDSPLAWELHRQRAQVVHQVLEGEPRWKVLDWGGTDDQERTHEDVTITLELAEAAKMAALSFAGTVLYKVLEDTVVDAVKWLIKELGKRLRKREITRAYVELPDGAIVEWASPSVSGDVSIWVTSQVSLSYGQLEAE